MSVSNIVRRLRQTGSVDAGRLTCHPHITPSREHTSIKRWAMRNSAFSLIQAGKRRISHSQTFNRGMVTDCKNTGRSVSLLASTEPVYLR